MPKLQLLGTGDPPGSQSQGLTLKDWGPHTGLSQPSGTVPVLGTPSFQLPA